MTHIKKHNKKKYVCKYLLVFLTQKIVYLNMSTQKITIDMLINNCADRIALVGILILKYVFFFFKENKSA